MKFKFLPMLAALAFSAFVSSQMASAKTLGDTPAARLLASKLAGHTFVANPADDEKNLHDAFEDQSALRKIVFGTDGSCQLLYPDFGRDRNLSFEGAVALDTSKGEKCTWSISLPNSCGDLSCAPFLNVFSRGSAKPTSYGVDFDDNSGDLSVELWHANSILHMVD